MCFPLGASFDCESGEGYMPARTRGSVFLVMGFVLLAVSGVLVHIYFVSYAPPGPFTIVHQNRMCCVAVAGMLAGVVLVACGCRLAFRSSRLFCLLFSPAACLLLNAVAGALPRHVLLFLVGR